MLTLGWWKFKCLKVVLRNLFKRLDNSIETIQKRKILFSVFCTLRPLLCCRRCRSIRLRPQVHDRLRHRLQHGVLDHLQQALHLSTADHLQDRARDGLQHCLREAVRAGVEDHPWQAVLHSSREAVPRRAPDHLRDHPQGELQDCS